MCGVFEVSLDDPFQAVVAGPAFDLAGDLGAEPPEQGAGPPAVLVCLAPQDAAGPSQ